MSCRGACASARSSQSRSHSNRGSSWPTSRRRRSTPNRRSACWRPSTTPRAIEHRGAVRHPRPRRRPRRGRSDGGAATREPRRDRSHGPRAARPGASAHAGPRRRRAPARAQLGARRRSRSMNPFPPPASSAPLPLQVRGLEVAYEYRTVVRGVDLDIGPGEGHALIGPSGSGKTSVARAIARLLEPSAGSIRVGGHELCGVSGRALRAQRHRVQMVFQEPQTSLDPRWRVSRSVAEPLRQRRLGTPDDRARRVREVLERWGSPTRWPVATRTSSRSASSNGSRSRGAPRARAHPAGVRRARRRTRHLDAGAGARPAPRAPAGTLARARSSSPTISRQPRRSARPASVLHDGLVVETGSLDRIIRTPTHAHAAALVAAARRLQLD